MAQLREVKRAPSKEIGQLVSRFKEGHTLVKAGSGHFHILGPDKTLVRGDDNQPISLAGTPAAGGPHYMKRITSLLEKADVLATNGSTPRESTPNEELRAEQQQAQRSAAELQASAKRFMKESEVWVKKLGGWDQRGINADLSLILLDIGPEVFGTRESAATALALVKRGDTPGERSLDVFWRLHEQMMAEEDPREFYFDRVRELRGFNPVITTGGDEWPYEVKLIKLDELFADEAYQRPVHELFARDLTLKFDERLVGVIDVSLRKDGRGAIMDGLQRTTAMREVGKQSCYAAVYRGMTLAEEAEFFFHKNRDRKAIHPYYHFRARQVAGDDTAKAINAIVERYGFKLAVGAVQPNHIAAIKAVEKVYSWYSPFRDECLTPTVETIKGLWQGRKAATDGELIRGLGRFFQVYADTEIQFDHWHEVLAELGPQLVIGRAKDSITHLTGGRGGSSGGLGVGRTLAEIHNAGLPRINRLDLHRLSPTPSVRVRHMKLATGE